MNRSFRLGAKPLCSALISSAMLLFIVSCRHENPVLQEKITPIPQNTRHCAACFVVIDHKDSTLNFSRQDWVQTRKKATCEETGLIASAYTSMPCSDFWMKYSLWNGEKRKNLMIIAIPPLTLYPIVDTVVLLGCFVGDCCIFPIVWCQESQNSPIVLPADMQSESDECISEFKIGTVTFRDIAASRTHRKMANSAIVVWDGNEQRHCSTTSAGTLKISQAVPRLFPIRDIRLIPEENVFEGRRQTRFRTDQFLNEEQKQLWHIVQNRNSSPKQKIAAWEKLEPVCRPEYYRKIRSELEKEL